MGKKMSKKYLRMAEVYKRFGGEGLDYSDSAKRAFYDYESRGVGSGFDVTSIYTPTNNGYAIGKKWLNYHISEWKKDVVTDSNPLYPKGTGIVFSWEIMEDYSDIDWLLKKTFPDWLEKPPETLNTKLIGLSDSTSTFRALRHLTEKGRQEVKSQILST
jgi:hypothetical protein